MAILNEKLISLDNLKRFMSNLKVFKKINVGGTSIEAANAKSELTFVGGDNVTIAADATKNEITISSETEVFVKSGSGASKGLVPTPPITAGTKKYLCEDGSWAIPDAARFAKETGIGYYSAGDTSCEVKFTVPQNNYVIQFYSSDRALSITSIDFNADGIVAHFNALLVPGALYVVTTEVEYPSNVDGVITGIGSFSANATTCDVPLDLDATENYSINLYNSNINTLINSYTYDSTNKQISVVFKEQQASAGSVYVVARKVE